MLKEGSPSDTRHMLLHSYNWTRAN
jgi:hypothetical protein